MKMISISDLKNTKELEKLVKESEEPVYVTKDGYCSLVVMDIDYYKKLINSIYEAKMINEGLDDLKNNKKIDGPTFLNEVKKRFGI